ncbi:amino acid adenylation domain-containing protein [Wenjunlia tyrosinilytica]|uniref:Carrier domain-containing protein n=1 Tax=Wenjunlia tyrosinilytica TaxID=1544741 RepID=A0A917ZTC7_9ACTN|nr:amino acid adenylation domain-containing protein [Wenjunlia tyrosinilytica]GGO94212.1 hypothetical protein GCM10012280_48530 [Wenjunlia tyrosinilytica]
MGVTATRALPAIQERLRRSERWAPGHGSHTVAATVPLPPGVGRRAVAAALDACTGAHPALRTRLAGGDQDAVLSWDGPGPSLEPLAAGEDGSALTAKPFDLERGPLVRAALVEGSPSTLHLAAHRCALDTTALRLLAAEVAARVEPGAPGPSGPGPAPTRPATAPAEAEAAPGASRGAAARESRAPRTAARTPAVAPGGGFVPAAAPDARNSPITVPARPPAPLTATAAEAQAAREELAGAAALLDLPLDAARGAGAAGPARTVAVPDPDGALTGRTEPSAVLAAYLAVLHRYTGRADLLVAVEVDRRPHPGAIGQYTELVPVRFRFDAAATASDLLSAVADRLAAVKGGPVLPHDVLAEPTEQPPRFSAAFGVRRLGPAGVTAVPAAAAESELALTVVEAAGGPGLELTHDTELVVEESADRIGRHVLTMLRQLLDHPDTAVGDLDFLGPEDHELLRRWGRTDDVVDRLRTVPELVARRARVTPDAVAAVLGERTLTFAELDRRADRLARHLAAEGIARGDAVGLCMPRCPELLVAMLAVHRAGAAALMLDPKAPEAYLGRLLAQAGVSLVVTTERLRRDWPAEAAQVLCLLESGEITSGSADAADPLPVPELDDIAYLVQTSGSTGLPKLVVVTHRGVAHSALAQVRAHQVRREEHGGWTFPPHTNVSVTVVVWAFLVVGAPLHIAADDELSSPERLRDWLIDSGVTQVFVVAPLAEALVTADWPERVPLRSLLTGSDRVRRWAPAHLPFEVGNWYGANEVNIVTTPLLPWEERITSHTATERDRGTPPPIGRPWPGVRLHILDHRMRPVPPGVVGELAVTGPEQTRGYLTAAQTAERFVPDPFGTEPGGRLYLTGDLVRFRHDGALEHRGRADHQVKIAGMRVEVAEVENALLAAPGVRAAAVTAPDDPSGTPRLIAYLVADDGLDTAALRRALAGQLPDHMVPQAFILLDALPLNSGDKIDRRALPEPDWTALASASAPSSSADGEEAVDNAPRTELEAALVKVWEEILGLSDLGVHDNFFLLGGDSLSANRAVRLVVERVGTPLKVRDLMLNPTPAELSEVLSGGAV